MGIAIIYRVGVDIREGVFRAFGDSEEYSRKIREANKGSFLSGQNGHSNIEEWAMFHNYDDAIKCEKKLMDVHYYFAAKLLK